MRSGRAWRPFTRIFGAPHMLTYREQVKDMVEDLSLNVLEEA
jgi:hypothetical protein